SRQVLQLFLQLFDLGPLAANDHARTGRMEHHLHFIPSPLDLHLRNAGLTVLFLDELADLRVFDQKIGELLFHGIPTGAPLLEDADAKSQWPNLLTHRSIPSGALPNLPRRPRRECATSS